MTCTLDGCLATCSGRGLLHAKTSVSGRLLQFCLLTQMSATGTELTNGLNASRLFCGCFPARSLLLLNFRSWPDAEVYGGRLSVCNRCEAVGRPPASKGCIGPAAAVGIAQKRKASEQEGSSNLPLDRVSSCAVAATTPQRIRVSAQAVDFTHEATSATVDPHTAVVTLPLRRKLLRVLP